MNESKRIEDTKKKKKNTICHKLITTGRNVGGQVTERKRFPTYPSQPPTPPTNEKLCYKQKEGIK